MPKGRVAWFDPNGGRGAVEHAGREYAVEAHDLPRDARTAGAPVHFDISHRDEGDVAVNVSFRGGSRTSRRTARYGDQTGARSAPAKRRTGKGDLSVLTRQQHDHDMRPRTVVEDWVRFRLGGDTDGATGLYAADAVIRTDAGTVAGQDAIRRHLDGPGLDDATADIRGLQDDRFRVVWNLAGDRRTVVTTMRVEHGQIVEHTEVIVPAEGEVSGPGETLRPPVHTAVVHGEVPAHAVAYAEDKVREVVAHAPAPVLHARVALAHEENPAIARPAVAKATLDVNGRPVRAHVAAESFAEAADLLKDRLRRGLDTLAGRGRTRRTDTGDSGEGEWRHGDLPSDRPDHHPRPPEDREVVRRKSYALRDLSPEEAALELDVLDFDWLLFTELATGADAVIERTHGGYLLHVPRGARPSPDDLAVPIRVVAGVPRMRFAQAREALDVSELPFLFYVEEDTDRGAVVYRRYDGHYGLVVPADTTPAATA